jgi:4-hydroxy-L-threonine phosphate dehydrogenase PdxA
MFHDNDLITITSVTELRARAIEGPGAAGSLLSERRCDACVAMYHDQGHIPIKILIRRCRAVFSIGAGALFASHGLGGAPGITGRALANPRPIVCTPKPIIEALTRHLEAPVA